MEASLFGPQRALYDSAHNRKVVDAGRRAGKTFALTACALRAARDYPGATIPVIERTLTCRAAEVFWRTLVNMDDTYGLGIKFHHTMKHAKLPNSAVIAIMSADTVEAADKIRGDKYPAAILDEAGTFRNRILEYTIYEALQPALLDYDGTLIMAGTPSPLCEGPFYDAVHGDSWEHHHWTMLDNPFIPDDLDKYPTDAARLAYRQAWLEDLKKQNGWSDTNPRLLREWFGRWVSNNEELVYSYVASAAVAAPDLTAGRWQYVLGIDLGFNDPSAFVVLAFNNEEPTIYVLESYEEAGLIPSAVAAHVERLRNRYTFSAIVADTGGYGKGVVEEMRQRFSIPLLAASKKDKMAHVAILNGDFLNGTLRVVASANRDLIADLRRLPKSDDGQGEHPGFANHLPDALLYGYRKAIALVQGLGQKAKPDKGSAEAKAIEEAEMIERFAKQCRDGTIDESTLADALALL